MSISPSTITKRHVHSTLISDLDPAHVSPSECQAALSATFKCYTDYRLRAACEPKLWPLNNGTFVLGMSGEEHDVNGLGKQFLKELLDTMPEEHRPLDGGLVQRITSLPALATAIRDMARTHNWNSAIPRLNGVDHAHHSVG